MSVDRLYGAIAEMRARERAPLAEELDDAAVWASEALGGDWVPRVRACEPDEALEVLRDACLAARTATFERLTATALAKALDTPEAKAALAWSFEKCAIAGKALAALVDTPARLRVLGLASTRLSPAQLEAICGSTHLATVERLSVRDNLLRDDGLAHLARTAAFPALRVLEASYTRASLDGIRALANASHLRPRALAIGTDKIGPEVGAVLAAGTALRQLRGLSIYKQGLGNGGLEAIAKAFPGLRTLRVMENGLGNRGVAALAASSAMRELEELRLRFDPVGSPALEALAGSPHMARLRRLQISQCRLDLDGLRALARSRHVTQLRELDLGTNPGIGPDAVVELARSKSFTELRTLDLGGIRLGDTGAAALATVTSLPRLEILSLQHDQLTDDGLDALARWPQLLRLRSLRIGTNEITSAGLARLLRVDGLRLEHLELWQTPCGAEAEAIVAASPRRGACRVDVAMFWEPPAPWFDR